MVYKNLDWYKTLHTYQIRQKWLSEYKLHRKAGGIVSRLQACTIFGEYKTSCKKSPYPKKG